MSTPADGFPPEIREAVTRTVQDLVSELAAVLWLSDKHQAFVPDTVKVMLAERKPNICQVDVSDGTLLWVQVPGEDTPAPVVSDEERFGLPKGRHAREPGSGS